MATNHRQTKAKIAKDIVDQVFGSGGRFLKKLEPSEAHKLGILTEDQMHNQDVYQVVGDDTIMEKAKQALRQNRNREDTSPKRTPQQSNASGSVNAAAMMNQMGPSGANGGFSPPLTSVPQSQYAFQQQQQQQYHHRQPTPVISNADQQAMYAAAALQQQGMSGYPNHPQANPLANNPGISGIGPVRGGGQNPMYSLDPEGYATYTTTLDDPEEGRYFPGQPDAGNQHPQQQQQQTFNRRQFMEMAGATGNSSRRSGMLGGRKNDPLAPTPINNMNANVGKRESLHLDEIFNPTQRPSITGAAAQSMQMSELMESFKGMSTTEFNSSNDTIGTIDNLTGMSGSGGAGDMSMAHMSGISQMSMMNMSSDSIFKSSVAGGSKNSSMSSSGSGGSGARRSLKKGSNSSDGSKTKNEGAPPPAATSTTPDSLNGSKKTPSSTPSSKNYSPGDVSFGASDFWKSDQIHTLMEGPMEGSSTNVFDHSHDYASGSNFRAPTTRLSITSETTENNDSTLPQHHQQQPIYDVHQVPASNSYEGQILPPEKRKA
ncbi:MAG: hypothetical protein SGARI_002369 [Bacillariaceae sp.]